MPALPVDRRTLLKGAGAGALAVTAIDTLAAPPEPVVLPDSGWNLWIDRAATWRDDVLHLPSQLKLEALPVNPPTSGWAALDESAALKVSLPTTVEQHLWGRFGERPYGPDEYRYAEDDPVPQNGAYRGVSWWFRSIDIPAAMRGKRVMLTLPGARLRAEIFLNRQLVGYSIMSELPIECDLSDAMRVGANDLAIRITNPGGRYDWRDSTTMQWGAVKLFASHGFGGLDRGIRLTAHPRAARIADAWILNTPDPRRITAMAEIRFDGTPPSEAAIRKAAKLALSTMQGRPVAARVRLEAVALDGPVARLRFDLEAAADTALWSMEAPHLHRLRFAYGEDARDVRFGFRWLAPVGIGTDAMLRLNGRRIKLYSAISWGYWGYNGLWPTPELARREVEAARALGLNCLHFHRNVAKAEVMDRQDEAGLLRVLEPGGGRFAIGRDLKPGESLSPADAFSRQFMIEKCVAMVRAFRSRPSVVHYTLQNEIGANLDNPDVQAVLKAMHDADPSRAVILNDGFVARGAAQAMYLPYEDRYYRSDVDQWGGWWNNHQGAGDQWYDRFYQGKDDYIHRQTGKPFIVEFGEMQGCAVADNHPRMLAEIDAKAGGRSYDREDHRVIVENTDRYLDRWGFRKAFPTAESLFLSIGRKCYEAWQNYMENIRIGDSVDIAAISGWESTAIENHSGIVDNLRLFKADPQLLRQSLLPVRPIAKQRRYAYATGEAAILDLYLLNDSGEPVTGELLLEMVDPQGRAVPIARHACPPQTPDRFSYLVAEQLTAPPFATGGAHQLRLSLAGRPDVGFTRTLWVAAPAQQPRRTLRIGLSGVAASLRAQLEALPGIAVEPFRAGRRYDGIVASGLKAEEIARRQIGEQTGLEAQPKKGEKPKLVLGELPDDVLAAVRGGTPLIAMVPEDGLAEGVSRQLAGLGLFRFDGSVGNLRAPWMGNWNYLRAHALFDGLPVDMAAGVLHQIEAEPSNGLLVEGDGLDVIAAYSRDHDRHNGAASFIARQGAMRVLVHRLPDMVAPLQNRFLGNAMLWLEGEG